MSLVSFVKAKGYAPEPLKNAIKESLDLIKFDYSKKAKTIVIKPNMCYYYHPSTGEVTDPRFVGSLIDVFRENMDVSEVFVVESDASAMKCKSAFTILGYEELAKEKKVKLVNLAKESYTTVSRNIGGRDYNFYIPELFSKADLVVNVPKPKYMGSPKISCALKNFFGCNAYENKYIYHKVLDEAIVAINESIKTNLVVLDGLMVVGGFTKRLDLVMSCEDPVALDTAVSKMMGLSPKSVGAITLAAQKGIGLSSFSAVGDFDYFRDQFPIKTLKDNLRSKVAHVYLRVFG